MFLEQIWPHIPTPLVYVLVLLEAWLAFTLSTNYGVLAFVFIWILFISFAIGTRSESRPFHMERLPLLLTLAFSTVSILASEEATLYEWLHLHDADTILAARIIYSFTWITILLISLVSYLRNSGRRIASIWPLVVLLTLVAAVFPLEPQAFIANQPHWLWFLRIHMAFLLYLLVTMGDAANITQATYSAQRKQRFQADEEAATAAASPATIGSEIYVPLARTLLWSPITLWIMFVPNMFLFAALLLLVLLSVIMWRRWRAARQQYHDSIIEWASSLNPAFDAVGIVPLLEVAVELERRSTSSSSTTAAGRGGRGSRAAAPHHQLSSFARGGGGEPLAAYQRPTKGAPSSAAAAAPSSETLMNSW